MLQSNSSSVSRISAPQPDLANALPPLKKQPQARRNLRQKMGIRGVMITSFVVPVVLSVGVTGWLAVRNSQQAVLNLTSQLRTEVTARVEQQLDNYLDTPQLINRINIADIRTGEINLQNIPELERHFWQQIQLFPSTSYIYMGSEEAIFSGAGPTEDGLPNVAYWTGDSPEGNVETYETDESGNRTGLASVDPGYNMFERPWYIAAQEAGKALWGDIYIWAFPYPEVALPAVQPIYGEDGIFQGVFAVDLSLLAIGDFLKTLEVSTTGTVFIMERDSLLVASSTEDPPFLEEDGEQSRLSAAQSESPLIQGAVSYLTERFGGLDQISQPQQLDFELDSEKQLLQVTPYQDELGLDWLIVVVIPESDFMAQINANTRNTIFLCGVALVAAVLISVLISRWIAEPVIRLSQASQAIARGELNQQVEVRGVGELKTLARSFNQMSHQLRQSFADLETVNTNLEARVDERTLALNEQTQMLQSEIEQLLDVVDAVDEGDLTVSAEVSPTAAGLIADTFNQLIERFGRIMGTVSGAAEQVNERAVQVEGIAESTAENARQQVESVDQMQSLMENINSLSQGNTQRVVASEAAMADAQGAVEEGQHEITAVNSDIDVLHQEMHQIVGRTQTLTSYTDLAAQFVKDQKRIASLTRVLAMNASMLSTRASQQQDPTQFAAITREFEAIASQVNDLATQTNQNLIVLQQRTEQIQTVVSGLNSDVDIISQRTDSLTSGVNQSNQAFDQIKQAIGKVASLGEQVTQSSQAIAAAAQASLQPIQDISEIAVETFESANSTTDQLQTMETVARSLRQSVALFQLPDRAIAAGNQNSTDGGYDASYDVLVEHSDYEDANASSDEQFNFSETEASPI
ncbi:MAG: methyl-accepting chemotaxis protein [Elainellaceae cyanobacterium]